MTKLEGSLELQLNGYRLSTAEILYHLPDHPGVLQSFVWQQYDYPPAYPRLHTFIDYWRQNIEAKLHTVSVGSLDIITPSANVRFGSQWTLQ